MTKELDEKLKSCPFCGSCPELVKEGNLYSIDCIECGCTTGQYIDEKQDPIDAWNTRATDKAMVEYWVRRTWKNASPLLSQYQSVDDFLAEVFGEMDKS